MMNLDEALTCADGHLKDYSSTPAEITLAAEVRRLREENERMEKAEAELAKLRGQKPVVFLPENWRPTRGGGVVIEKCVRQEVDRLAAVSLYDRSAVRELIAKAAGRALEAKILSAALLPD